jgi:uncharacterized YigZ family protein
MTDEYKTIAAEVRSISKVRGSRFIATAVPVKTAGEAREAITRLKKEFHDATHNCSAYRLGVQGEQSRSSDDGEPAGSAGKPILASLEKFGLTDLVVVVTRYFGGTRLGVPGLARAYGGAAELALESAVFVTQYTTETVFASFPHSHISQVMHVVSKHGARIADTWYDEEVHVRLEVRRSRAADLKATLFDQTRGNIEFK